jgi:enoyl-CoA hydratase
MFTVNSDNSLAVLRLAHGKVSAMDLRLTEALTEQLQALAADECRALVITGTGNTFSAGVDLVQLTQGGADYVSRFLPAMDAFFHALLTFPKPVVAAVNGHALAGGCIIAACCDHVVMNEMSGFVGVTELKVGVPFPMLPLEIVRARLTPRDARDLVYTARTLTPQEAQAVGLVDELAPPDDLLDRALAAASRLASIPAVTLGITKRAFVAPILDRVSATMAIDADTKRAWEGDEVLSAVRDFLAKRATR